MTTEAIRRALAEQGRLAVPVSELADDADLYAAGLSSLATVQVMLAIEEALDVEFPEHRLNRATFASIANMRDAVSEIAVSAAA